MSAGTLKITAYDKGTGAVSYVYTLTGNILHPGPGADVQDDVVLLTLVDGSSISTTANLVVKVVDDVPVDTGSLIQVASGNANGSRSLEIYDWKPGADRDPSAALEGLSLIVTPAAGPATTVTPSPVDGSPGIWSAAVGSVVYYFRLDSSSLKTGTLVFTLYQISSDVQVNIATLTLNANGADLVAIGARSFGFTELDTARDVTTPGAPVGSIYLPAGNSTDVLITALIGSTVASVNTSNQGWGVKAPSGGGNAAQTLDLGESLTIRFFENGALEDGYDGNEKLVGVQDFRFTPSGYTGGMTTAGLKVTVLVAKGLVTETVILNPTGLVKDVPVTLSSYLAQAPGGDRSFASGWSIASVTIENLSSTGGLRIDNPSYPEYQAVDVPRLQASFALAINDRDADKVVTNFTLDIKGGQTADPITVTVAPDVMAEPTPASPPTAVTPVAPVVIDLGGDGFNFLSRDAGITFDYAGTGQKQATAWAGAADALLAYDVHQDGRITDAREFVFTTWAPEACTDLQALALAFDSNCDGVLSALDAEWSKFGLWLDANSNGISDNGEFVSLTDLGIRSLNLGYEASSTAMLAAGGDVSVAGTALVTWEDGRTAQAADAAFLADTPAPIASPVALPAPVPAALNDALTGLPLDGSIPTANPPEAPAVDHTLLDHLQGIVDTLLQQIGNATIDPNWQALIAACWGTGGVDPRPLDPPWQQHSELCIQMHEANLSLNTDQPLLL